MLIEHINLAKCFLYAGNGKYLKEFSTLILNGIVVSGWHVSSASVIQTLGCPIGCEQNQKQWRLFPNWNIYMTIQWQALSVYMLASQLHMLFCSKTLKTQQISITDMQEKPKFPFLFTFQFLGLAYRLNRSCPLNGWTTSQFVIQ